MIILYVRVTLSLNVNVIKLNCVFISECKSMFWVFYIPSAYTTYSKFVSLVIPQNFDLCFFIDFRGFRKPKTWFLTFRPSPMSSSVRKHCTIGTRRLVQGTMVCSYTGILNSLYWDTWPSWYPIVVGPRPRHDRSERRLPEHVKEVHRSWGSENQCKTHSPTTCHKRLIVACYI